MADLIKAKNDYAQAQENLQNLTQHTYGDLADISKDFSFDPVLPDDINIWQRDAIKHNALILAQRQTMQSYYDAKVAAYADHLPTLSMSLSYDYQHVNNPDFPSIGNKRNAAAALNLSWNFFSGGAGFAASSQASHNYLSQQSALLALEQETTLAVRNSFLSLKADSAKVKAYKTSYQAAKSAYLQSLENYKLGGLNLVTLLDQLHKQYDAAQALTAAKYQYVNDYFNLYYQAGLINEGVLIRFNKHLELS
jgi:outer membrane protein